MELSLKLVQLHQDGPLYILRGHRLKFPNIVFLSPKINFVLANSAFCDISSGSSLFAKVLI